MNFIEILDKHCNLLNVGLLTVSHLQLKILLIKICEVTLMNTNHLSHMDEHGQHTVYYGAKSCTDCKAFVMHLEWKYRNAYYSM